MSQLLTRHLCTIQPSAPWAETAAEDAPCNTWGSRVVVYQVCWRAIQLRLTKCT